MGTRVSILGVPIDPLTMDQVVDRLRAFLQTRQQHHVCTPNPEMLVRAASDIRFLSILEHAALNTADGTGLLFAARFLGMRLPERVTGTDLVERVTSLPDARIFLLGAAEGVADAAADRLRTLHPASHIVGTFSGSPVASNAPHIISLIRKSGANVLLVAFGAPAQECWIHDHLPSLSDVRIAMGVGGAFDFLASVQKRAPTLLRTVGMEWLWRLIHQPSRLPRIVTATVRFPLLLLRYRSASPLRRAGDLSR